MNNPQVSPEKFEQWCGIELFGHSRLAGFVTEATIGGVSLLRVDVPKPDAPDETLYTTYLGNGAIYRMTPTTKDEVVRIVSSLHPKPPTPRTVERDALNAYEGDYDDDSFEGDYDDDSLDDEPY